MRAFVIRTIVTALGLYAAAWLLRGITLADNETSTSKKILTILLIAAIFGIINSLVRPIVTFFSIPFIVLTLGLFLLVINAAMLMLLSWLSGKWGLPLHVDHFWWTAVFGSIIISIVSMIANAFLPERDEVRR